MALKRFVVTKEKLHELYWQRQLTSFEVAEIFGCTAKTVINRMREYGIRSRNSGPARIKITRPALKNLYVYKKLSAYRIAEMYKCDQGVVLRALRKYKFIVRHPKRSLQPPISVLQDLYSNKGLSTYKIARRYRCEPGTIRRYLGLYAIPIRRPKRVKIGPRTLRNLYLQKKLSLSEVAKIYNCTPAAVLDKMRMYKIPRRSISETSTLHIKSDFDGTQQEKAYMIGFGLGDLGVSRRINLIHISSSTTKAAQADLIESLFENYGPVWIGKRNAEGAFNVSCSLNNSFSFLLPKHKNIPPWILSTRKNFLSFLAGYTDAEGNIAVSGSQARFRLRSYDKGILLGCHRWLRETGIKSLFVLVSKAGIYNGIRHNKDCWSLTVNEKKSVYCLLNVLRLLLRHGKRKNDLEAALANIASRLKNKPHSL